MTVKTLVIGYTPLKNIEELKPAQLRAEKYFKELLGSFDLGELHFAESENYKEALDSTNPFMAVVFGEYYAQQVNAYKKDVFIYITDHPRSVFHRKKDIASKQEEQRKIFEEIELLVKKIREEGKENQEKIRKISAMNSKDWYEMIKRAIISDRPELQKRAWDLLNRNDVQREFIWMRGYLLVECWQAADAKGKEKFLTLAMEQHIDNGVARQLEDFTDAEGLCYKQYMFLHPSGVDLNYIRRIPIPTKDMGKWAYESLLQKYETPNGLRLLLEAGQAKELFSKTRTNETR